MFIDRPSPARTPLDGFYTKGQSPRSWVCLRLPSGTVLWTVKPWRAQRDRWEIRGRLSFHVFPPGPRTRHSSRVRRMGGLSRLTTDSRTVRPYSVKGSLPCEGAECRRIKTGFTLTLSGGPDIPGCRLFAGNPPRQTSGTRKPNVVPILPSPMSDRRDRQLLQWRQCDELRLREGG